MLFIYNFVKIICTICLLSVGAATLISLGQMKDPVDSAIGKFIIFTEIFGVAMLWARVY